MPDPSPETDLLNRPPSERIREYKYRFAQSTVFGLPVLVLHFYGPSLGGNESSRWIGFLQILLAGWIVYVGILAMVVEAIMRKRITVDSIFAGVALAGYGLAGIAFISLLVTFRPIHLMWGFPMAVLIAMLWNGIRWKWMVRRFGDSE